MKKQSLTILAIVITGFIIGGIAYAQTTISDTNITTPSLTVTGTCTGCGASEGNFINYNTVALNTTLPGSEGSAVGEIFISNAGNVILSDQHKNIFTTLGGSVIFVNNNNNDLYSGLKVIDQTSVTGNYTISTDTASKEIVVTKNNVVLQRLGFNVSQCSGSSIDSLGLAISPNGKYIALGCTDTGAALNRLVIFQGS